MVSRNRNYNKQGRETMGKLITGQPEERAKKTFTPLTNWIAVQPIKADTTEGGLSLLGSAKEAYRTPTAWVIAVGPDCKVVKVGDKVLASSETGAMKVKHKDQEVLMIREDQLLGIEDKVS